MVENRMQPGIDMQRSAPKDAVGTFKRMFLYLSKCKWIIFWMLILLAATTVLNLFIPDFIGKAIDVICVTNHGESSMTRDLITVILSLIIVFILSSMLSYFQGRLAAKLTRKTVLIIREDVSHKLLKLPVAFFDTHKSGDILSRLTNDIDNISNLISQSVGSIISSVIVIVGCTVIMIAKNWMLALVCLSTVVLNVFFTVILSKKMYHYFRKQQKTIGELNSHIEQSITAKKTIDCYNMTEEFIEENSYISDKLTKTSIKALLLGGAMSPLMCIIGNINFLLIVAVGAMMYINGGFGMTIGTIQAFTMYSRQFTKPINELAGIFSQLMTALASAERVFEIVDAKPEVDEGTDDCVPVSPYSIRFENVCFSYIRGVEVLKDFSLTVEPGKRVAIVGRTGIGKTTLMNLLMRFYEPDSGRILINDIDIRQIEKAKLRSIVTTVLQDTTIVDGTISENISYGNSDATSDEIVKAAELSHANEFISRFGDGYDTELSQENCILSKGQKQLLCLARASLRSSGILVLDEALSSVDSASEYKIQNSILNLMQGYTCIIIAHRLSTIKDADLIAVIDKGRVVELGKHQDLMDCQGLYYTLYKNHISAM